MAPRVVRAFVLLVGVSAIFILMSHFSSGIRSSSVSVINNLNLYSQNLAENKDAKNKTNNLPTVKSKESFRSHNEDSDVKVVQEEKIPTGKVTGSSKPFDELPPTKAKETKQVEEKKDVKEEMKACPSRGSNLVGPLFIDQSIPKDMLSIDKQFSVEYGGTVEKGGLWYPSTCKPIHKVAIIIPYRRRMNQLKIFLKHMHPFLQKQLLHYQIFLVEQLYKDPFNRAGLFNVGFVEALKVSDEFDCFIFTDVDLLPEDDRNYYGCPTSPRHMSVAVDKFHYQLPYATLFGGVGAFLRKDFEAVNGMSNLFFGWGGEDDDLYKRVKEIGWKISRPPQQIGRYTMISVGHHQSSKQDPNIESLLHTSGQRMVVDGLNSLKYSLKSMIKAPLVTIFRVEMKRSMYNLS